MCLQTLVVNRNPVEILPNSLRLIPRTPKDKAGTNFGWHVDQKYKRFILSSRAICAVPLPPMYVSRSIRFIGGGKQPRCRRYSCAGSPL